MSEELIKSFIINETLKGLKDDTVRRKVSWIGKLNIFAEKKGCALLTVTEKDIKEYLEILSEKLCAKEYNSRLSCIKGFYSYLKDEEAILINPAENLESRKVRDENHLGLFTEGEVKRMLEAIPGTLIGVRDRGMLELMYSSALRINELVSLDVDDIDLRHSEVRVRYGKGERERIVPVGEMAVNALSSYLDMRFKFIRDEYEEALFLSLRGLRINAESVRQRIHRYKELAGVENPGVSHAFRHACATHMLKNGAPLPAIRRILGHSRLSTTEKYTHLMRGDLREIHKASHPKGEAAE